MRCPVCNSPLTATTLREVEIDKCDSCGGRWLDAGELQQFVDEPTTPQKSSTPGAIPDSDRARQLTCPRCPSASLVPTEFKASESATKIVIDTCSKCGGIWLDRGELERIRDSVDNARDPGPIRWVNLLNPSQSFDLPMALMF